MSMNMNELKVSFAAEKLDALRFFMGKKQQAIEQELQEYLDKTYEKIVPTQVREYVESHIEQPSSQGQESTEKELPVEQQKPVQQQVPEPEKKKAPVAKNNTERLNRHRKGQAAVEQAPTPGAPTETEGPTEQEEGQDQGMSMSMGM